MKFHDNPSSVSGFVARGLTDRRTDMTKLIVAFRNFAKAPKMLVCLFFSTHFIQAISNECKFFCGVSEKVEYYTTVPS